MNNADVFQREPTQLSRRVGADWLVTTQDDPQLHELRGGAAFVWEELAAPATVEELVAATAGEESEAPREAIRGLVDAMCGLGIIRVGRR